MKNLDWVQIGLIVSLVGAVLIVIGSAAVTWNNSGSRNLTLATGALVAAIVLNLLQLKFELRAEEAHDFITAELTVDRQDRVIRQWQYPMNVSWRIHVEIDASEKLSNQQPELFDGDRERLTADMVVFSLISYITTTEIDWQVRRRRFVGSSVGTMMSSQRLSKASECTTLDESELRRCLQEAGNLFSEAPLRMLGGSICLPPRTELKLTEGSMILSNPFFDIEFKLESSQAVSYTKPRTGGDVPKLESGEARYETRLFGLPVRSRSAALRANHAEMPKYREWADRFVCGVRQWFEGRDLIARD
ncbi:MAG: hypothetical protein O7D91_13415 [Planctomycetota bacterium]|nr:hypothetical protein [Planctomycetota bacterium]